MADFGIVDTRHIYDRVFSIYVPIGIGVCAFFILGIIGLAIFYRQRPNRPPSRFRKVVEADLVEGSYAVFLAAIAVLLLYITFSNEHREDTLANRERPAVSINAVGSRWIWTFRYPVQGIVERNGDGVGYHPLVVPVNEPVRFTLTSEDVIHSFWIPQIAFKRDAMPGTREVVTLDFDHTGNFTGSCAEYCGIGHPAMVFRVHVISDSAFKRWLASGGKAQA